MLHPFAAHRLNKQLDLRVAEVAPLPESVVQYTDHAVRGLHAALRNQVWPVYRRPEHPVDGWGLLSTQCVREYKEGGVLITEFLGSRTIYLATQSDAVLRVLTTPHPRDMLEERVVQIRRITTPQLLQEDPTLHPSLIKVIHETVQEFDLDYHPEAPQPD